MAHPEIATTGRTGTLTYTAEFTLTAIGVESPTGFSSTAYAACPLGTISLATVLRGTFPDPPSQYWEGFLEVTGKLDGAVAQEETLGAPPASCTWTADVEEVYIIANGGFVTPAIRWRLKPGGTISGTCGLLTWSATVDNAILQAVPFLSEGIYHSCSANGYSTLTTTYPASASVTWTAREAGLTWTWPTQSKTDWSWPEVPGAGASTTASGSGCSVSTSPVVTPPGLGDTVITYPAAASMSGLPDRAISATGRIYRGDVLADDSTYTILPLGGSPFTTSNGTFAYAGNTVQWDSVLSALNQAVVTNGANTRAVPGFSLSLSAPVNGEQGGPFSYILGPRREVGTLTKLGRRVWFGVADDLTPGAYGNGWTAPVGALTTSTAALVTISGPDNKSLVWLHAPSGKAFTHLRLRMKRHAAGPRTVRLRYMVDGTIPAPTHFRDWDINLRGGDVWDTVEIPLYAEHSGPDFAADSVPGGYYLGPSGYFQLQLLADGDYSVNLLEFFDTYDARLHWCDQGTSILGMSGPAQTLLLATDPEAYGSLKHVFEDIADEPSPYTSYGQGYAPGWQGALSEAGVDAFALSDTDKAMAPPSFEEALLSGAGKAAYLHGRGVEYAGELIIDLEDPLDPGILTPPAFRPRHASGATNPGAVFAQWAESNLDYHSGWQGFAQTGGTDLKVYFWLGMQFFPVVMDYDGVGVADETITFTGPRLNDPVGPPFTGLQVGATNAEGFAFTRGKESNRVPFPPGPFVAVNTSPSDLGEYLIYPGGNGRFSRVVFVTTPVSGALTVDSARGWLHVAEKNRVKTYRLDTGALAYEGEDLLVDQVVQLWHEPRGGSLYILGRDGNEAVLHRSRDGGRKAVEVVRVTAKSMQGASVGQRAQQVLLYSDGSGAVWRRIYQNESLGTPVAAVASGSQLNGYVADVWHDERQASALLLLLKNGSTQKVYRSKDNGLTWALVVA